MFHVPCIFNTACVSEPVHVWIYVCLGCVQIHNSLCACLSLQMCRRMRGRVHVLVHLCARVYMHVYMYVFMYVCTHVYVCLYVCVCVRVYVCVCMWSVH